MATTTQTTTNVSAENKTYYDRVLLSRLKPNLVYAEYGQKKSLPKNEGDTINFRRFESITPTGTPLTEGVTPDGKNITVTALTATVSQYGDYVVISDKLDMVGIDPVLTETAEDLGESAALAIDTAVRDVITVGTNVQYAGAKANSDAITTSDIITSAEIKKAVRTLKKNNAKPLKDGFFIGIIDPETAYDIQNDTLWQDISKYNGGTAIMKGEIGKLGGVRFIETTNTKVTDNKTSVPVHATMIIGKDAYGVVDIDGTVKPEMIIKEKGSAGTDDPLNQRATAGWKAMFTAKRLQELAMIRIEHAVTA